MHVFFKMVFARVLLGLFQSYHQLIITIKFILQMFISQIIINDDPCQFSLKAFFLIDIEIIKVFIPYISIGCLLYSNDAESKLSPLLPIGSSPWPRRIGSSMIPRSI